MKKMFLQLMLVCCAVNAYAHRPRTCDPEACGPGTCDPLTNASDTFKTGKIIDPVVCPTDATQSYALYIPARAGKGVLPVVYFFDPHGAGALPLQKYKALAEAYGFIMIGSNNSKNGNDWSTTEKIWRHLSDDTRSRLPADPNRLYTCGLSGGAKVAGYVAIEHVEIKGVIANGAGLPDGVTAGDFSFSFTAMAGEGDMNLTELVAINKDLEKSRTRHRIIIFDGKHEWAPEASMSLAFTGWQFDAMIQGILPKDPSLINGYMAKSKKKLELYNQAHQLLKAERECRLTIQFLDGLSEETAWFIKKMATLTGDPSYKKQRQAYEDLLVREQNMKAVFMQHFEHGDNSYWSAGIGDLRRHANTTTEEGGMYQRLLAYLSLAFYSISNQLINGNQNNAARRFVELYKMADPGNSEAWYFSAILQARERHAEAAENDLIKAVENGFRDEERLKKQPEFRQPGTGIDLSGVERKMHEVLKGS